MKLILAGPSSCASNREFLLLEPMLLSVGRSVYLLRTYSEAGLASLKEAGVISLIDIALSGGVFFAFGFVFFDVLGILLLIEGAGIMLVGGALGFAGQPGVAALSRLTTGLLGRRKGDEPESTRKKPDLLDDRQAMQLNDIRAAFYMLMGALLFLESMALAFIIH